MIKWIWNFIVNYFKPKENQHTKIQQNAIGNNITQIGIQNRYDEKGYDQY